ncbi:hypothetical protein RFI_13304 [Reticulomyxa filosa]|uniref:Uncharacterized protein n=1 Tax=Reticulomyxa filosa TaxID=46433 RepID=X6NEX2_RETFI|nr:hypothetical protein RFI_13304 [Reticulomyxa filosa]|eukprot:ETO23862.1 hypothetical protein RFI_13304 [Reticulomyxa filosa]
MEYVSVWSNDNNDKNDNKSNKNKNKIKQSNTFWQLPKTAYSYTTRHILQLNHFGFKKRLLHACALRKRFFWLKKKSIKNHQTKNLIELQQTCWLMRINLCLQKGVFDWLVLPCWGADETVCLAPQKKKQTKLIIKKFFDWLWVGQCCLMRGEEVCLYGAEKKRCRCKKKKSSFSAKVPQYSFVQKK